METLQSFLDLKLILSVGLGLGLGVLLLVLGMHAAHLVGNQCTKLQRRAYSWANQRRRAKEDTTRQKRYEAEKVESEQRRVEALEIKVVALQQHAFCRTGCGCHGEPR